MPRFSFFILVFVWPINYVIEQNKNKNTDNLAGGKLVPGWAVNGELYSFTVLYVLYVLYSLFSTYYSTLSLILWSYQLLRLFLCNELFSKATSGSETATRTVEHWQGTKASLDPTDLTNAKQIKLKATLCVY